MGALALGAWVIFGSPAAANAQNAEALYKQGLKDMLDKQYATGCPAIEESYRLDPLPGALFTLSACYERWGKVHTAVVHYERFVSKAGALPPAQQKKQAKRIGKAQEKLRILRPQVPRLVLAFDTPPPADVVVTVDGQSVALSLLGEPQAVDPGEHNVAVRTADGQVQEQVVPVGIGVTRRVALHLPGEEPEPTAAPDQVDEGPAGGWSGMHTGAVVAGGIGVVGLLIGGITGGMVFARKGDVEDGCPQPDQCSDQDAVDKAEDTQSIAMASNVGFAVGAVGVAAGVVLWLLAPPLDGPEQDTARLRIVVGGTPDDPAGAMAGVRGSW